MVKHQHNGWSRARRVGVLCGSVEWEKRNQTACKNENEEERIGCKARRTARLRERKRTDRNRNMRDNGQESRWENAQVV